MFNRLLTILLLLLCSASFGKDVSVKGYYRSNGTYVKAHHRSAPDGKFYNNWSTYGNVNPYTGAIGTKRTPPTRSSSRTTNRSPAKPREKADLDRFASFKDLKPGELGLDSGSGEGLTTYERLQKLKAKEAAARKLRLQFEYAQRKREF